MNLLFDQNISFRITKRIKDIFPDSVHVSDCGLQNGEDQEIWEYAKQNDYAIVTFDSDFYDISVISGHPPKVLWIRTGNFTTPEIAKLLSFHQKIIDNFLHHSDFTEIACLELGK
jgi:predicted nuclease of predicted toxin-antitoxin system